MKIKTKKLKKKQLNIRLDVDTLKKLKEIADKNKVSTTEVVRQMIDHVVGA